MIIGSTAKSYSAGFTSILLKVYEPEKFQQDFSGIDTARELRLRDNKALIIFTTASREYACDASPIHLFDYIVKPCAPEKLGQVLSDTVSYILRLLDISAVMSRDHFVEVVLSDGRRRCLLVHDDEG